MRKLIAAVFDRRMAPITRQRLAALDAVEKAAGRGPLPLEGVLEAMFRPVVLEAMTGERAGPGVRETDGPDHDGYQSLT